MSPLTRIPDYLRTYVVQQDPSLYTPIDHSVWRFILKIAQDYFKEHAHQKYLDGLRETGISTERIPLISEMDACLQKFGWRAVAVSGFIPPAVFMEFMSIGVLTIACDMRSQDHLAYTPAPDIVHEAAGHAPIIADPDFRDYLTSYGEVARRAIMTYQDMDVYHAIRLLSDTKENPKSTAAEIAEAQQKLDAAYAATQFDSEAALLSRMGWWTFEYGLVGSIDQPKIYGAGLLSSVGESYHCLGKDVRRVPFSIDCIYQGYDITRPQPQLFVASDFEVLKKGLQDLAARMAFKRGGRESLEKARAARTVTTTVLDSDLQISGILEVFSGAGESIDFLRFQGPVQLSFQDHELPSQGASHHKDGYSTPIGKLAGRFSGREPQSLSEAELNGLTELEFASGICVRGRLRESVRREGKTLVLVWDDCTVTRGSEVLFKPEWGTFDMACGTSVPSVFGGAADRSRYLAATGGFQQDPGKPKTNLTPENTALNELYAQVRTIREAKNWDTQVEDDLAAVCRTLDAKHSQDWLLRFELLELAAIHGKKPAWATPTRDRLAQLASQDPTRAELLQRGMALL